MSVSPFDSALYGGLLSDPEIAAAFGDQAEVSAMLRVEAALARVEGRLRVIPAEHGETIARVAETLALDPTRFTEDTAASGVPVPALVESLRKAVGGDGAQYVHWGATSQDVIDSALTLRLRDVLGTLDARLETLVSDLAALARRHRDSMMVARTRGQQALPTTFGLKVANWLAPLARHRRRLAELKPRVLVLQFGGAAGTLAALEGRGLEVTAALADELGLACPAGPWHTQRDGPVELGHWCALVTGSLGKLGQDVLLMAQNEVGELREGGAGRGGSSTLPQKANPISSETLIALARFNAGLLAGLDQAMLQEHERGGAGWTLEWLTLPQMVVAAGSALRQAGDLIARLEVRPERMRANLEASGGLVLAEAASFALSAHMPRPEAQAQVKAACRLSAETGRPLIDILRERVSAPVDWAALGDPANHLGEASALLDRLLDDACRTADD